MHFPFFRSFIVAVMLAFSASNAQAATVTLADFITPWEKVERPSRDTIQQWSKALDARTRMDIFMLGSGAVFYTVRRSCLGEGGMRTTVFTAHQKVLSATDCRGNDIRDSSIAPWMFSGELPVPVRIALIENRRRK